MFVEEVCGVWHIEYVISSHANLHLQRIFCDDCGHRMVRGNRTISTSVKV